MTTRSQPGLLPGFLLMRVRRQKIGASRDLPAPSILQRRSDCGPLRHRGFSTILKLVCGGMLPGSIVRVPTGSPALRAITKHVEFRIEHRG
jgi:hypothetical protein